MYENYNVLFVDDEVNILSSLKRGLYEEEFTCYFAQSGKEAIKIMGQEKIAVIVSDMRMPEMDGLALLREVKARWPKTVRIVLSGYTQLQQILTTINQVDVFKFITKPWKLEEEFKHVLFSALDFYILQEENEEYKTALQKKNLAYQNILKSIDSTIANAKRGSEILGACGKAILASGRNPDVSKDEKLLLAGEKIFDYFAKAVTTEERELLSGELIDEIVQLIHAHVKTPRIETKSDPDVKVKVHLNIIEAAISSCMVTFIEEFTSSGLLVNFGALQKNCMAISLISLNIHPASSIVIEDEPAKLDKKISYINSALENALSLCRMSFHAAKTNGSLIIVITIHI